MYLSNLSDVDRSVARAVRAISIGLLGALTLTGIWQFFFHQGDTAWSRYQLGSDRYLHPSASTGIAETHAALADLAGLFTLFVLAWLSARVLHRVSWFALGVLAIVLVSLYTGTLIRYNATFDGDTVITSTRGYSQFFLGSVDGAITDRFELGRLAVVFWTLSHILSIPVLVFAASLTLKRSEARRLARKGNSRSWLEALPIRR